MESLDIPSQFYLGEKEGEELYKIKYIFSTCSPGYIVRQAQSIVFSSAVSNLYAQPIHPLTNTEQPEVVAFHSIEYEGWLDQLSGFLSKENARNVWKKIKNETNCRRPEIEQLNNAFNIKQAEDDALDTYLWTLRKNTVLNLTSEWKEKLNESKENLIFTQEELYRDFKQCWSQCSRHETGVGFLEPNAKPEKLQHITNIHQWLIENEENFNIALLEMIYYATLKPQNIRKRCPSYSDHPICAALLSEFTRTGTKNTRSYTNIKRWFDRDLRRDESEPGTIRTGPSRIRGRRVGPMSGIG